MEKTIGLIIGEVLLSCWASISYRVQSTVWQVGHYSCESIPNETIPVSLRQSWIQETYQMFTYRFFTITILKDPADCERFWDIWKRSLGRTAFPSFQHVFASEFYGEPLAKLFWLTSFIPVDIHRDGMPISAAPNSIIHLNIGTIFHPLLNLIT